MDLSTFRRSAIRAVLTAAVAFAGLYSGAANAQKAPGRDRPAVAAPPVSLLQDLSYVRAGELLLRLPNGWRLTEEINGSFVIVPPNVPAGESVKIVLSPIDPPKPALRDHMQAEIDAGQKLPGFVQESPIAAVRQPANYEVLGMLVSFHDKGPLRFSAPKSYAMVVHLRLGANLGSAPVMLYATTKELAGQYMKTFDAFVSDLRVPSLTILAPHATQPLTLRTVNQANDFLEWLLDVPFTHDQRQRVGQYLVDAWAGGNQEGIDAVQSIVEIRKKLDALTPEQKAFAREAARAEALKVWREDARTGDSMARMMVDLYDAAHAPLARGAEGEPPLTRQNADAAIEIIYFMASKAVDPNVRGFQLCPTPQQKEEWAGGLAARYAAMSPENKQEIAEMASKWAALRMLWPELSGEDRATLADGWLKTEPVQALVRQVKSGQSAARTREVGDIMRKMDAHQQLINMGAYRLNYRYVYR